MVRILEENFRNEFIRILVPTENIATIENNAVVLEGVSRVRNALINGDYQSYDWDTGRFEIFSMNQRIIFLSYRLYMPSNWLQWDCYSIKSTVCYWFNEVKVDLK